MADAMEAMTASVMYLLLQVHRPDIEPADRMVLAVLLRLDAAETPG